MPTALITGGSQGLGMALAAELSLRGWDVTITGRRRAVLDAAIIRLPAGVRAIVGDVADPAHRERLVEELGDIDLLINNASALGPSPLPRLAQLDPHELRKILDVNVVAPLALAGALLPGLRRRHGTIINVSSDAAVEPYETWGGYGASKAALDHASAVLGVEEPDVLVYAFDPGDMRTEMHQAAFPGEDISDRPLPESVVPAIVRLLEQRPESGRYRAGDLLAEVA